MLITTINADQYSAYTQYKANQYMNQQMDEDCGRMLASLHIDWFNLNNLNRANFKNWYSVKMNFKNRVLNMQNDLFTVCRKEKDKQNIRKLVEIVNNFDVLSGEQYYKKLEKQCNILKQNFNEKLVKLISKSKNTYQMGNVIDSMFNGSEIRPVTDNCVDEFTYQEYKKLEEDVGEYFKKRCCNEALNKIDQKIDWLLAVDLTDDYSRNHVFADRVRIIGYDDRVFTGAKRDCENFKEAQKEITRVSNKFEEAVKKVKNTKIMKIHVKKTKKIPTDDKISTFEIYKLSK